MKLFNRTRIFLIAIFALALTSCKKELTGTLPPDATAPTYTAGEFQPTKEGFLWVYNRIDDGGKDGVFTLKATKDRKSYDSLTYTVFVNYSQSSGLSNAFIGVNKHDYFIRQNIVDGSGTTFPLNILYLNDTLYQDDAWSAQAGIGNGYTAKIKGVIIGKDIKVTVNGYEFQHVMHSQVELYYEIPDVGEFKMAIYDYYVAPGIGIIRRECVVTNYSNDKGFQESIISYTAK